MNREELPSPLMAEALNRILEYLLIYRQYVRVLLLVAMILLERLEL
jgi:hypothetical protein